MSFLSKDDKCHLFDTSANGYTRGEGGGFVVLKRMDLALRDGNTIRAVVRATGANQDGRTLGLTQPSAVRQADLIRQTYESAGLPLHETNYFEAHGTGTAAGDPVECSAIGPAFSSTRQRPLYVGSVKSNVGHLESCSGIVGMVKAVYSLESGWMAPTHGLTNINPKIKLAEWKIDIPTRATRWPAGLRRISINNFGYGGANAHVVIDDAYHYLKNHNLKAPHNTTVEELLTNSIKGPTTIPNGPTSRLFLLSSHEESGIHVLAKACKNTSARSTRRRGPKSRTVCCTVWLIHSLRRGRAFPGKRLPPPRLSRSCNRLWMEHEPKPPVHRPRPGRSLLSSLARVRNGMAWAVLCRNTPYSRSLCMSQTPTSSPLVARGISS